MFPSDINFEEVEEIIEYMDDKLTISSKGKSPLFDFSEGEFVFDEYGDIKLISDREAVKLWINKNLRTVINRYEIYYENEVFREFGTNLKEIYFGHKLPHLLRLGELERDIKEALMVHEQIRSVENIILNTEGHTLYIQFTVTLVDDMGSILIEKEVRVPYEEEIYR